MFCNPFFDIASIVISFVIIYFYGTSKKISSAQNRVFIALNLVNALTAIFDLLNYYAIYAKDNLILCKFFALGYFITHIFVVPLLFNYILLNIKSWYDYSKLFKSLVLLPLILMLLVTVTNPFTSFVYYYDQDFNYYRQPGMVILYSGIIFYIATIVFVMQKYKKLFPAFKRGTFYTSLGLIFISVIVQLFSVETRLESFGITYALLLIFLTIQDPHDEVDYDTGLYNKKAFDGVMELVVHSNKKSKLIAVYINNYVDFFKNSENKSISKQLSSFFKDIDSSLDVFIYSNNLFCLYTQNASNEKMESIIEIIQNRFNNSWSTGDINIKYNAKICLLNIPEDADNITTIHGIIDNFVNRKESKSILTIDDFDYRQLERASLINSAITNAINEDLFELIFTPIYNIKEKKIDIVDISFRFLDPQIGYVEASEIIPFLEKQGKLPEVLEKINFKILNFFMSDSYMQLGLKGVAIKITSVMTIQSGALEELCNLFDKFHADTSLINFEISELLVHKAGDKLAQIMPRLASKGYKFILCEYGSGYSNISAIYDLPFKGISIDGNVVRAAFESKKARTVLKKTLELAKQLNMLLVLSGIIDPKYFEMIQYFPSDYARGSYFYENQDLNTFKETLEGGQDNEILD